ncbi:MAG: tyrosine-type recombinase/integrase [Pseudomonas sp.]
MPIIQRGQSFQVTVNHKGERFRRQFPSDIEARAWEAATNLTLSRGQAPDMGVTDTASTDYRATTMGKLAEYMVTHKWAGTKAEKSAVINLNHMVKIIGADTKLTAINAHVINLAVATLKEAGYPETTINKKLSPARVCFKYAAEQGWMDRVPSMPFYKPGEGRIRWFTEAEEKAMLDWCRSTLHDLLWDYIVVSIDTGMRQGEALDLKARNLADGRVTLWGQRTVTSTGTKNGHTRVIPLTVRAREALERLALDNPGHLFPATKDQLIGMWNRMRDALGFREDREYVPHVLRHTFCTRLVKVNVNLAVIQKLAGHERIETTLKYTKVDDDLLVEAIGSLASRVELVYTPATSGAAVADSSDVACHNNRVVPSTDGNEVGNVLIMQRKLA